MNARRTIFRSPVVGLLTAAMFLVAQTPGGTVSGSVTDPTGGRVAGATVWITNVETHETHTSVTGAEGDYLFPSIATGAYVLEAQASGF